MPALCIHDLQERRGDDWTKNRVAGDQLTRARIAKALIKYFEEEVVNNEVTREEYRNFGFPVAPHLANNSSFIAISMKCVMACGM